MPVFFEQLGPLQRYTLYNNQSGRRREWPATKIQEALRKKKTYIKTRKTTTTTTTTTATHHTGKKTSDYKRHTRKWNETKEQQQQDHKDIQPTSQDKEIQANDTSKRKHCIANNAIEKNQTEQNEQGKVHPGWFKIQGIGHLQRSTETNWKSEARRTMKDNLTSKNKAQKYNTSIRQPTPTTTTTQMRTTRTRPTTTTANDKNIFTL